MNSSWLTKSGLALMVYAASTSVMAGVFIASANQSAVKTTEKECIFPLNAEDSEITSFDCFPEGLLPWSEKIGSVYQAGYINAKGDPIIPFEYEETVEFAEGLARVKKNGKYGFINRHNQVVIPFIYSDVHESFSEGLAPVSFDGFSFGYINQQGEPVISFRYSQPTPFRNGLAFVTKIIEVDTHHKPKFAYLLINRYEETVCEFAKKVIDNPSNDVPLSCSSGIDNLSYQFNNDTGRFEVVKVKP